MPSLLPLLLAAAFNLSTFPQIINSIKARVRLSLKGDLLSSRSGGSTRLRVDALEEKVAVIDSKAQAALKAAKENEISFGQKLQAAIEDLASGLDDIQGCHKQGLLYDKESDKCTPVVGTKR